MVLFVRNETDQTAEFLKGNGFNALSYHAGKTANSQDAQIGL